MPCMGPDRNASDKIAEEIYTEVMFLMERNYNIRGYDERINKFGKFKENWEEATQNLKKAIQEVVWEDACCSF